MDKETLVKVVNRDSGVVGYKIPDGARRQFAPRQEREIPFGELVELSYLPGGSEMLLNYLVIRDEEVVKELFGSVEPEYFYTEKDIRRILSEGSTDEFLDCLDFAPYGVIELIKDLAVAMPLNDNNKREIILKKLNFDVTGAINVNNTKFDGDEQKEEEQVEAKPATRRTAAAQKTSGRRVTIPKYDVISENK